MSIKVKSIAIACMALLFGVICYFQINRINMTDNISDWNFNMSVLIIIGLIVMIFILNKTGIPLFSFTTFFMIVATSFNCGQCLVNYLGLELSWRASVYVLFGADVYREVTMYACFGIYFCFLGIIFGQLLNNRRPKLSLGHGFHIIPRMDNYVVKHQNGIIAVLFAIGLSAQLYITYNQITNNIVYGYSVAAWMLSSQLITFTSKLLLSAMVLALFRLKERGLALYVMYLVLNFITMIGGVRAYSFLSIVVVTYVYVFVILEKRMRLRSIVGLSLLALVAVQVLVAIREIRKAGFSIEMFIEAFISNKNGAIGSYFAETTATQAVLGHVINNQDSLHQPFLGQLLSGITSIVPGISKILPVDYTQFQMRHVLNLETMGGSFISDFYVDHVLILGSFAWGIFINWVFFKFESERNILKCAFWSPIVTQILLSVRTSVTNLPRMIVWTGIIFNFIVIAFRSGNRNVVVSEALAKQKSNLIGEM